MFPHNSAFLAIPVAVLLGGALVMDLLARHQRQLALHLVALPVQLERYTGVALVLRDRKDLGDLLTVQQQFSGAGGVGYFVGAGRVQWRHMAAQQVCFAVANHNIGVGELRFSGAHAFDFPACQCQTRFEGFVDMVFKSRLLVLGNHAAAGALAVTFFSFSGHGTSSLICRADPLRYAGRRDTIQGL